MIIQLIDNNKQMCEAWELQFKGCKDVRVFHGDVFEKSTDCIISPANSFGFMNAGLDLIIIEVLGFQAQERLQMRIKEEHNGELLVGQAILLELDFEAVPFLISAPTMRVPMILNDSVNVYLASRAIFLLLKQNHHRINTVTISGLGTGVGKVPYDICAKQMKQAYDDVWLDKFIFPKTWYGAQKKHQLLYSDEYKDLQY
ncbi:macro domain-containing protein [Flavobacterium sp. W22_SRS_FP1]|uniref:macro domain-containing protein n=1 Tax=Flavobacterium sp. W22_SRS_FP1 TaxID=3240276 RepID=UPI003F8F2A19